jgi:hypothetical protein
VKKKIDKYHTHDTIYVAPKYGPLITQLPPPSHASFLKTLHRNPPWKMWTHEMTNVIITFLVLCKVLLVIKVSKTLGDWVKNKIQYICSKVTPFVKKDTCMKVIISIKIMTRHSTQMMAKLFHRVSLSSN